MKIEKALVIGNRPLCSKVIELSKNALIIAADAGADRLLKYNIVPDWIIKLYSYVKMGVKKNLQAIVMRKS